MVMLALHSNVRQLVDAETSRVTAATPQEMLARTQALFFYQIIRLFDGDVILRAQGEKDMALLQAWLGELCDVRDNLEDEVQLEDDMPMKKPPKEWKVSNDTFQVFGIPFAYRLPRPLGVDILRMRKKNHRHGILCRSTLWTTKELREQRSKQYYYKFSL